MSVPNQKIVKINKPQYTDSFLTIGIDEWQAAFQELRQPSAFALYLYLAGNRDGFSLELSQEATKNSLGISKSTYHRAIDELIDKGYLTEVSGNVFSFHTSPADGTLAYEPLKSHSRDTEVSQMGQDVFVDGTEQSHLRDASYSRMNTEIDNTYKTNKIDKFIYRDQNKETNLGDWEIDLGF